MNKRIKIAYICPWFDTKFRGPLYNLLNELSKYIDVVCMCSVQKHVQYYKRNEQHEQKTEIINPYFKIHRFRSKSIYHDIIKPIDLKRILDEEKPDIVQSDEFFRFTSIQAANWCKKNKVPFILNSRMRYRRGFVRNFAIGILKIFAKDTVKQAKKIIATQGLCSKTEFLRWFPEAKDKIEIIPTGLDMKFKNTSKKQVDEFRKKYNIPNKPIILNVARVYSVKRIDLLVRAFALVKKEIDASLVIVGPFDDEEKKKLDKLIKKLNVKDVIFTDAISNENIALAYASSDLFVNTSETEGICFSFLEAMIFKLPIVTFDVGGNNEVVEKDKNGYLLKFGDVEGVARKIIEILKNKDLKTRLGNYGYEKLKKEFDIKINAGKLVNIYNSLLNK